MYYVPIPRYSRVRKSTLESGIDVAPWINVPPGNFEKNNKRSPLNKHSPLEITANMIFYTQSKEIRSKKGIKKIKIPKINNRSHL